MFDEGRCEAVLAVLLAACGCWCSVLDGKGGDGASGGGKGRAATDRFR
jgi:hypothetical protein